MNTESDVGDAPILTSPVPLAGYISGGLPVDGSDYVLRTVWSSPSEGPSPVVVIPTTGEGLRIAVEDGARSLNEHAGVGDAFAAELVEHAIRAIAKGAADRTWPDAAARAAERAA